MKVVVLGWGSLIGHPKDLATKGDWQPDGPYLPIEFARISGKNEDRLTLVCMEGVQPIRTYWIRSSRRTLEGARENLRCREGCPEVDAIGYLTRKGRKRIVPFPEVEEPIRKWLAQKRRAGRGNLDWSLLQFQEKDGKGFLFGQRS
ncbi:MAG TPA: hypothetical protein VMW54_14875 [Terriglobia bacterium]|nr:hypothetical protein [Terriglobia bacterium]